MQQQHRQTNASAQAHRWTRLVTLALVTASVILGGRPLAAQAQLTPGDILVVDQQAGTEGLGALFRLNPVTGERTQIHDFGVGNNKGRAPFDVAVEASGTLLVSDREAGALQRGALFRVDPVDGTRTLLSDFADPAQGVEPPGVLGGNPAGIAIEASGTILVSDQGVGTGSLGLLFRVDPVTGGRTQLSDFGDDTQGPTGHHPHGVAVEASGTASGTILVVAQQGGTGERGALFRVDPVDGTRTLLSDFGVSAQGPLGRDPWGMAVEASGTILVMDYNASGVNPLFNGEGVLFRVNPVDGTRTRLSDFGCSAGCSTTPPAPQGQGPRGVDPVGVAVEASGTILVIDFTAGTGMGGKLFRVNPVDGKRTELHDFGLGTAPKGVDPIGIAVVPEPIARDTDGDGILDEEDNCPSHANPNQADFDGDEDGDVCDTDDDNDSVVDTSDNCPFVVNPDQADNDSDLRGDVCDVDDDNDGVPDNADNCPFTVNPNQTDTDDDGVGNACDADPDGDGVTDGDNCPLTPNLDQTDTDGDGTGDACDADDDNDGDADHADNCPVTGNPDQEDLDEDGIGDACDADIDGDSVDNGVDNCPLAGNPAQDDTDEDGAGDACDADDDNDGIPDTGDNCPLMANAGQTDTDGDGVGDACDGDLDGDGVDNSVDNCRLTPNFNQKDFDGDGQGDACDADIDGDGVGNSADVCGLTPAGEEVDPRTGCSIAQLCPCEGPRGSTVPWRNHGQYVSCVTKSAKSFQDQGLITEQQKEARGSEAAQSSCGHTP